MGIDEFYDNQNIPMEVGDVVIRKDRTQLRSGCASYSVAVVISLEPFALASELGDMLWQSTVQADDFESLCRAPSAWREAAMRRLPEVKGPNVTINGVEMQPNQVIGALFKIGRGEKLDGN